MDPPPNPERAARLDTSNASLLQALLATSADMITISDRTGHIIYASPATVHVSGYTVTEFLDRHPFETIHPDDRPTCAAALARLVATPGLSLTLQHRIQHKDGTWRWVEGTFTSLFDDPMVRGLVATVHDITAIKRIEDALRESEARFRLFVTATSEIVYRMSADWREMYALDGKGVLADTRDPSRTWLDAYIPDSEQASVHAAIAAAVRATAPFALEHRVMRADGTVGWVVSRAIPLVDARGAIVEWFGTASDITDRKRTEDALRTSEEQQSFLVTLSDAIRPLSDPLTIQAVAADLLGAYLRANQAHYGEMIGEEVHIYHSYSTGLPPMIGTFHHIDFGQRLVAGYRAGTVQICSDTTTDPQITDAERQVLAGAHIGAYIAIPLVKNGDWVATVAVHSIQPRVWSPSEVALVHDVAERTWAAVERARAEAALRASEARYRMLFESMDEGFCTIEVLFDVHDQAVDYRFLETNSAFVRQTGIEHGVGRTVREFAPDHEAFWFEVYGRVATTGDAVRFEHAAAALGRYYDVYAFRVGAPGEHRVAVLFNDISARKQAEADRERLFAAEQTARAEAEAALQMREHFLSIASHELRTPLTALIGYLYLLPTLATNGPAALRDGIARITQQAQRLNTLIDQLLDVAGLQRGQFALDPAPLDLAALVAQVVEGSRATQSLMPRHAIDLHLPDAPVPILGDATRLEQVLQNLLSNAVKYSPQGGLVQVRVTTTPTEAVVAVSDAGIGIPAVDLGRLFEPFFRASNIGNQVSGFGLGLHIVQEIIQRHGGGIEVESTEGRGSTFRVILPRGGAAP